MKLKIKYIFLIVLAISFVLFFAYPYLKSNKKSISRRKAMALSTISHYISMSSVINNNITKNQADPLSTPKPVVTSIYKNDESDDFDSEALSLETAFDDDILAKEDLIYNTVNKVFKSYEASSKTKSSSLEIMPWVILVSLIVLLILIIKVVTSRKL